jgi:flagellar hook-associated protein 3 FlgL
MMRVSTLTLFRSGEQNILARQRELLATQLQVSSGKRINAPSDDPTGAAEIAALKSGIAQFSQYKDNQGRAQYLLNLNETALSQFLDGLNDVRERLVEAGNGAYSDAERTQLAQALQGTLARLVGIANSSDGTSGYLFAGAREQTQPFTQSGNNVGFGGDSILQKLEVSKDRFQQVKFSGDSLFMKLRPGNGTFVTAATATNTGSAAIDAGSVSNPALVSGDPYTITFSVSGGATTYQVVNTATSAVVASGNYTSPVAIAFDGIQVNVNGTPANGDSFSIAPANYQSVFDTVAQAISALQTPASTATSQAQLASSLSGLLASVDQAIGHIQLARSDVGSALAEIDAYGEVNDDRMLEYQTRRSTVEDLDYAQGLSELTKRQTNYQAALQSYSAVSKLSLFDYL